MSNQDIKPETAERLNGLIGQFVGSSEAYYKETFGFMMQAPGYRSTLNWVSGLLGPVWFGARGLWNWMLGFLLPARLIWKPSEK